MRKRIKNILKAELSASTIEPKTNIRVDDNFFLSIWWESRDEYSDTTDRFMKHENGREYWITLSIWNNSNNDESVADYSPSQFDEFDNYDGMADYFTTYINEYYN